MQRCEDSDLASFPGYLDIRSCPACNYFFRAYPVAPGQHRSLF